MIVKEEVNDSELTEDERDLTSTLFKSQMPTIDKTEFNVSFASLKEDDQAVVITQSEYMRRMKDMAQFQPGMSFYGDFPTMYNFTLNTTHPVVKKIIDETVSALNDEIKPINEQLSATNAAIKAIRDLDKDGKGIPEDQKDALKSNENKADELREKKNAVISNYGKDNDKVHQLIDIALLGNGLLRGEALSKFLRRSVDLLK